MSAIARWLRKMTRQYRLPAHVEVEEEWRRPCCGTGPFVGHRGTCRKSGMSGRGEDEQGRFERTIRITKAPPLIQVTGELLRAELREGVPTLQQMGYRCVTYWPMEDQGVYAKPWWLWALHRMASWKPEGWRGRGKGVGA